MEPKLGSVRLPDFFRPSSNPPLLRLGRDYDGGYIVAIDDVLRTESMIACGINDDWSFEADFFDKAKCRIDCYDQSVTPTSLLKASFKNLGHWPDMSHAMHSLRAFTGYGRFFHSNHLIRHYRKNVGRPVADFSVSMEEILSTQAGEIFIKLDIEGSEYYCLNAIMENEHRITGCVIEFHEVPLFLESLKTFFGSLQRLKICHVHVNNFGDVCDSGIPQYVEVTMTSDQSYSTQSTDPVNLPSELDMPNNRHMPDPKIYFDQDHL